MTLAAGSSFAAEPMGLARAFALALAHDPAQAVATAEYDAARELGPQERALLKPSVFADGKAGVTDREVQSDFFGNRQENYGSYGAGVELRQPLFRWDWFARRDRASADDALAEAGRADRRLHLFERVAQRYFGVLLAQDALVQAMAEATAVGESLDDTRKRYEVELVPGTDLKEAQARDDVARARLLSARQDLENAVETLAETTGEPRPLLPTLAPIAPFPGLTPPDAEGWVKLAHDHSPRLAAAREQVRIARANVTSRRAEAAPTLDAVATYRRDDTSDSQIGQLSDTGAAMLEVTVPIYAGGINNSRVREAEARLRVAEGQLQQLTLETERSIRQSVRQVMTSVAQVGAFDRALASAQAAETATRHGYDAGTRTITDVLDAKSRTVQARRELNQTRLSLLLALMQLKIGSGTLDTPDFEAVDRLLLTGAPAPAVP